ncbi:hypothetical protein WJX77_009937 [Trebouxia sp. C0004]
MHMDDDETAAAAAPANAAEGNMAQAKAITKIIDDPSMTAAEKQQEISTTFKCWGAQPIASTLAEMTKRPEEVLRFRQSVVPAVCAEDELFDVGAVPRSRAMPEGPCPTALLVKACAKSESGCRALPDCPDRMQSLMSEQGQPL